MSSAASAAKRALQQERARILYRRSLKQILSWAVHREIFYVEANKTRAAFEANRNVDDLARIDRLITEGEAKLAKLAHPDPYTVPWAPGGSKYARSPPVPPEVRHKRRDKQDLSEIIERILALRPHLQSAT